MYPFNFHVLHVLSFHACLVSNQLLSIFLSPHAQQQTYACFSFTPAVSHMLCTCLGGSTPEPVLYGCGNSNQNIYGKKGRGFNHKDITQDVHIIVCFLDLSLAEQTYLILLYFHSKLQMVFVMLSRFCFCSSASSVSYRFLTWWHSRS